MAEILKNKLYLGSLKDYNNIDFLKSKNITDIIPDTKNILSILQYMFTFLTN